TATNGTCRFSLFSGIRSWRAPSGAVCSRSPGTVQPGSGGDNGRATSRAWRADTTSPGLPRGVRAPSVAPPPRSTATRAREGLRSVALDHLALPLGDLADHVHPLAHLLELLLDGVGELGADD